MSRIKTSFDTSILDGSTVNDLFESIGLRVLDKWDSEQGDISSFHNQSAFTTTSRLEKILETPSNKLKPGWCNQLRSIIEEMEPTDFAIYGKRISLFLLAQQELSQNEENNKLSTTIEPPPSMTFDDQSFSYLIPELANSKLQHTPKSKKKQSRSPKSPKSRGSPTISYASPQSFKNSSIYSSYVSTPPVMQQKSMYSHFPKWLPTMANNEE